MNAGSRIGNADFHHIIAGRSGGNRHMPRFTILQRLHGIANEVDQHLLDLNTIRFNPARVRFDNDVVGYAVQMLVARIQGRLGLAPVQA